MLDWAVYSAFESTLNSPIVSYRIVSYRSFRKELEVLLRLFWQCRQFLWLLYCLHLDHAWSWSLINLVVPLVVLVQSDDEKVEKRPGLREITQTLIHFHWIELNFNLIHSNSTFVVSTFQTAPVRLSASVERTLGCCLNCLTSVLADSNPPSQKKLLR